MVKLLLVRLHQVCVNTPKIGESAVNIPKIRLFKSKLSLVTHPPFIMPKVPAAFYYVQSSKALCFNRYDYQKPPTM